MNTKKTTTNLYEVIASQSTDLLSIISTDFRYLVANYSYASSFNLTPQAIIGKHMLDIFREDLFYRLLKPKAEECFSTQQKVIFSAWITFGEGPSKFLEVIYLPYYENNKLIGYIVNARNRTNRKLIEDNLREQTTKLEKTTQRLEQSNQTLSNFATNVAHDLKSPLATINTLLEVLTDKLERKLDDNDYSLISNLNSSSKTIQELINSMLNFSKVNANTNTSEISLKSVVDDVLQLLFSLIEEKKATISYNNLPNLQGYNHMMMVHLFQNLIENAIKFSKNNERSVISINEHVNDDPNLIQLVVADNGRGIADTGGELVNINTVIEPKNGSNLGLKICKRITSMYDGQIYFSSKKGEGTELHLFLKKNVNI